MFKKTPECFLLFFIGCKSREYNGKSTILLGNFRLKTSIVHGPSTMDYGTGTKLRMNFHHFLFITG